MRIQKKKRNFTGLVLYIVPSITFFPGSMPRADSCGGIQKGGGVAVRVFLAQLLFEKGPIGGML